MNKDYQFQYRLSQFINIIRKHLLEEGFFEHHLYSTLNYKIENTDTFKLKDDLYLRYNPEPDIWQVGLKHDKFFWIGSMFRNEKEISELHRNEFTVTDIYLPMGTMKDVINKFLDLLKALEGKLELPQLSEIEFKFMTHEEFNKKEKKDFKGTYWLVVTDYPVEESFYDAKGIDENYSQKFEIFLVKKDRSVEMAACGKLGMNSNKNNFISTKEEYINTDLLEKGFIGFGFGLERLMVEYNQ